MAKVSFEPPGDETAAAAAEADSDAAAVVHVETADDDAPDVAVPPRPCRHRARRLACRFVAFVVLVAGAYYVYSTGLLAGTAPDPAALLVYVPAVGAAVVAALLGRCAFLCIKRELKKRETPSLEDVDEAAIDSKTILKMLRRVGRHPHLVTRGLKHVLNMAREPEASVALADAGAIEAVVKLLKRYRRDPGVAVRSCGALYVLAYKNEENLHRIRGVGGVAAVKAAVDTTWSRDCLKRLDPAR